MSTLRWWCVEMQVTLMKYFVMLWPYVVFLFFSLDAHHRAPNQMVWPRKGCTSYTRWEHLRLFEWLKHSDIPPRPAVRSPRPALPQPERGPQPGSAVLHFNSCLALTATVFKFHQQSQMTRGALELPGLSNHTWIWTQAGTARVGRFKSMQFK